MLCMSKTNDTLNTSKEGWLLLSRFLSRILQQSIGTINLIITRFSYRIKECKSPRRAGVDYVDERASNFEFLWQHRSWCSTPGRNWSPPNWSVTCYIYEIEQLLYKSEPVVDDPVSQSVCLSVFLSLYLLVCMSVCLFVCLSVCMSVYHSVCLSAFQSLCLSVSLYVCLSLCLSVCLSAFQSLCLSVSLYVCLSLYVCQSVCLLYGGVYYAGSCLLGKRMPGPGISF